MSNTNIKNEYTDEIICPFCGLEFSDSWECSSGEEDLGLMECDECGKYFYASRHITITYSTEKAKYGTCKKCNSKNKVLVEYRSSIGSYENLCIKCGDEQKEKIYNYFVKNF